MVSLPRRTVNSRGPVSLLLFATLVAAAGNGISIVAFPWLVLQRSGSALDASVVAGALTTAATALITQHNAQATVGISGGLVSAALALSTINPKGRKIEFYHERNLLRPIWDQTPVNTGYPLFVWKMLHTRQFSNSGSITLAESIRSRWLQFQLNGKADKDKEGLLFGSGGYYHSDELHL